MSGNNSNKTNQERRPKIVNPYVKKPAVRVVAAETNTHVEQSKIPNRNSAGVFVADAGSGPSNISNQRERSRHLLHKIECSSANDSTRKVDQSSFDLSSRRELAPDVAPVTSMMMNSNKTQSSEQSLPVNRNPYQKKTSEKTVSNPYQSLSQVRVHVQEAQIKNDDRHKSHPVTISSPINPYVYKTTTKNADMNKYDNESSLQQSHPIAASSPINPYTRKPMIAPRSSPLKPFHGKTCSVEKTNINPTEDGNHQSGGRPPPIHVPDHIIQEGEIKDVASGAAKNKPIHSSSSIDLQKRLHHSCDNKSKAVTMNKFTLSSPINPYKTEAQSNLGMGHTSCGDVQTSASRNTHGECSSAAEERHSNLNLDSTSSADTKPQLPQQQHEVIARSLHGISNPYKRQCLQPSNATIKTLKSIKPTSEILKKEMCGTTGGSVPATSIGKTSSILTSASSVPGKRSVAPLGPKLPPLPTDLQYDRSRLKHVDDEYRLKLIKAADLGGTFKNGWKLLPHQKVGVLKSIQMRHYVLAYDMGLGKTLIGCVWAKAFKKTFSDLKVYIIAPVSLKKEWNRTAADVVGLKCEDEKAQKAALNQDSLDIRISSWAKIPLRVPPNVKNYVVICDEAHNLQSMESGRTQDTLKLVNAERCIGVLLLTGTPMKNGKPSNLFPLLKAARHPFGDNQQLYEIFFCNGQLRRFRGKEVWDASGSSNLGVLNAHIGSHVLYKTKEDCLKELPGKKREYKKVPVGSKFGLKHTQALNDLANIYQAMTSNTEANSGGNDAILGAFARLRQVAAFAKIDATVALVKSILLEEPSVVIFTYFVAVAKEVHRKLQNVGWTGELLVGETPSAKRQAMVDNFQDGISPVFIATFGAGGVGITLTAARTIILMDRPWTPGDALQAEDRVRRIGQTKIVRSIWMRAFDIDEQIDNLIEHKSQNASTVVDSKHSSLSNMSKAAPKISIRQLVQAIVSKKGSCTSA